MNIEYRGSAIGHRIYLEERKHNLIPSSGYPGMGVDESCGRIVGRSRWCGLGTDRASLSGLVPHLSVHAIEEQLVELEGASAGILRLEVAIEEDRRKVCITCSVASSPRVYPPCSCFV